MFAQHAVNTVRRITRSGQNTETTLPLLLRGLCVKDKTMNCLPPDQLQFRIFKGYGLDLHPDLICIIRDRSSGTLPFPFHSPHAQGDPSVANVLHQARSQEGENQLIGFMIEDPLIGYFYIFATIQADGQPDTCPRA